MKNQQMEKSSYNKFFLMLAVSFILMYAVMYLNVNDVSHVYFSATRLYMTFLMITVMAVVMLLMMRSMYTNKIKNFTIITGSIVLFILSCIGVHRQTFIGDKGYLRGMIPHHSIAIMTSENAHITDPETRRLADSITSAQKREILQMKRILKRLE